MQFVLYCTLVLIYITGFVIFSQNVSFTLHKVTISNKCPISFMKSSISNKCLIFIPVYLL